MSESPLNGRYSADEFLEMQRKRNVRDIALSIEDKFEKAAPYWKEIATATKVMSRTLLAFGTFLAVIIIIVLVKGSKMKIEIKDWIKIDSVAAEVKE